MGPNPHRDFCAICHNNSRGLVVDNYKHDMFHGKLFIILVIAPKFY